MPIPTDSNGNWSLRLTGTINIPANRGINFVIEASQAVTVKVDGYVLLHDGPDNDTWFTPGQEFPTPPTTRRWGHQARRASRWTSRVQRRSPASCACCGTT